MLRNQKVEFQDLQEKKKVNLIWVVLLHNQMKTIKYQMFNLKTMMRNNKINKKKINKIKMKKIHKTNTFKTFKSYVQCVKSQNALFFVMEFVEEVIIKNVLKKYFPMMILPLLQTKLNKLE